MTYEEAAIDLATPEPEPFRQVTWTHADYARWDAWRVRWVAALLFMRSSGLVTR